MPTPRTEHDRRKAHRAGRSAEWAAVVYLRLKGYRILARRFLVKGGAVDIVARRGATIAFVEVKLRATLDDALASIVPAKRHRISRAARVFVARHRVGGAILRADAVYLVPWRWPLHIADAFALDLD